MWIAESQMMKETIFITKMDETFFPLKNQVNIERGNALTIDWKTILSPEKCNYIMGNPPFVGARLMEQGGRQKEEIKKVFGNIKNVHDLDYVTGWYRKAAEYAYKTEIEIGFVSTNSIVQGSQVPILWNVLLNQYQMKINFAHQTFLWGSESNEEAHVHVVIIGMSGVERSEKMIFSYRDIKSMAEKQSVKYINSYLLPAEIGYIDAHKDAICDVPKMSFGNQPRDGGFFVLKENEKDEILRKEPELEKWIRLYIGADEFIKGKKRWCLWLKHAMPSDIKNSRILYDKVQAVKQFRLDSKAKTTNGYAKVPHLFAQITQPDNVDYLLIPSVSSERREYIPIGFMSSAIISSNAVQIVPNATLYHFGVLTSNVHMAWMRTVAGRLKSDFRYSKEIVYNSFPWPQPTEEQIRKIEETAQKILDTRDLYKEEPFSVLYDPDTMPRDLQKAHIANDIAVMRAYGFSVKDTSAMDCVAALMQMYQEIIRG